MRFVLLTLFLFAFPAMVTAQSGVRTSDTQLDASQLSEQLNGQIIEFFDGSKSRYGTDGSYEYTYTDDGPVWAGQFTLSEEGRVCVDFDNGSRRCDQFVKTDGRLVLVTTDGLRFPVRNRTVYHR